MAGRWRGEGAQDRGARPYQEDSWALRTLPDGAVLAVIADGMGGHAGGATASKLVVDDFVAAIEAGRTLRQALDAANEAVRAGGLGKPELAGMGSTLIAALVREAEVCWISVGDSPFYLAVGNRLERLNADHSMAPQIEAMRAKGILTAEEAAAHPSRHTLREAVMGAPLALIDEGSRAMKPGETLLLCSDGVETLAHDKIAAGARRTAQALVESVLAARAPHQDNVTIIKLEEQA
ncbi:MAG: serine/threonine-protein phosphatase [Proteobacteria bacterium]|nr:serine/threonine-protein phosphatase [Pseudomonadota bacterium]